MNKNISRSIVQLNEIELKELTAEIKETVAKKSDLQIAKTKFTAAQLWKIQKSRKMHTLFCRRFLNVF